MAWLRYCAAVHHYLAAGQQSTKAAAREPCTPITGTNGLMKQPVHGEPCTCTAAGEQDDALAVTLKVCMLRVLHAHLTPAQAPQTGHVPRKKLAIFI
jgi:hypothetical protein